MGFSSVQNQAQSHLAVADANAVAGTGAPHREGSDRGRNLAGVGLLIALTSSIGFWAALAIIVL